MKKKITFAVIIIIGIIVYANYQKIYKSIVHPKPRIVSSSADGTSSTIFNYSMKVKGEVTNEGGDGYIVVKANAFQDGKTYTKSQQLFLESYQTSSFEFVFDEVKLLKKQPTYNVKAFVVGDVTQTTYNY